MCAQGPTYSVTVNGGECEILGDGSVECEEPFVELSETPFTCNLPYREAAELEVRVCGGGSVRGLQGLRVRQCCSVGLAAAASSPVDVL